MAAVRQQDGWLGALAAPVGRYAHWLHTRWPAGTVERLPAVNPDGSTNVAGVYVTGDLTGIPLLKFSSDSGARAVQAISADPSFQKERGAAADVLDLVIIGAGVSGVAAALEAKKQGLSFRILEATQAFSTIVNFPKAKPIYTYPRDMRPAGDLQFAATIKEPLVAELNGYVERNGLQITMAHAERVERHGGLLSVHLTNQEPLPARRVIIAIGRSGNFRRLGVPGEDLAKVANRLHDPKDFRGKQVLVVGGGDSALEAAIALAVGGARVTLSYRKREFSRPKPENADKIRRLTTHPTAPVMIEHPTSERVTTAAGEFMDEQGRHGTLALRLGTEVTRVAADRVTLRDEQGREETLTNDAVFTMIGREAPLEFFRRSGIRIHGEWTLAAIASFAAFLIFCLFLYLWKAEIYVPAWADPNTWWKPFAAARSFLSPWTNNPKNFLGTVSISAAGPAFYYTLAYCACVVGFGVRRIRRRQTRYVLVQTLTLMAVQCLPLFLLPEVLLPWAGHNGWFDGGAGQWLADQLFEPVHYGQGRAYWRAYGLILAFPLNVYNVFTDRPLWAWLVISAVQTFVLIPLLIRRWGKGAYCGWICSCGALAETLGDAHRQKMPHGPFWNRVNMLGQAILLLAFVMLGLRILGWIWPAAAAARLHHALFEGIPLLNYHLFVDIGLAGVMGLGCYFWFSGRVWCRFACPLAALMHIYARFSRFRIFADKKKCISCNVCTSVCHQGIDVMNFANKGVPLQDPECVRCSACVQSCPTGVLSFGALDCQGQARFDRLAASPVQRRERDGPH